MICWTNWSSSYTTFSNSRVHAPIAKSLTIVDWCLIGVDQNICHQVTWAKPWYTHALSRNINYVAIDSQICFHRPRFQPWETTLVHYRACGATGGAPIGVGGVPNCCQWPFLSIRWIVYISVTYSYWEHSTIAVCALTAERTHLDLNTRPHPHPPPIHPATHSYTTPVGCKTI